MALNGPPLWATRPDNLHRPERSDHRLSLRQWLLVAAAVSLVIAVGIAAWNVSRLAAPALVGWQISLTDEFADAPPLPDLPVPAKTR
ncbi:hypothetical protein AB0F59_29785 [Micromonospora lupini]|uniref:hypothetical protein n=1 Tax=Micromonospora lupini TaxID=285679 RepID=UPI0033C5BA1B